MGIQLISYRKNRFPDLKKCYHSTFATMKSLDEFDLNIIDMTEQGVWCSLESYNGSTINDADIKLLSQMITTSNSNIFILLPQDGVFFTYAKDGVPTSSTKKIALKHNASIIERLLVHKVLGLENGKMPLKYTNTKATINDLVINGIFTFVKPLPSGMEPILCSDIGEHVLSASINNWIFMTTLDVSDTNVLKTILKNHNLYSFDGEPSPEWFKEVKMFDDNEQNEIISIEEGNIRKSERIITEAKTKLEENKWFKSMLYKADEELVEVVTDVLEKMLDLDLSGFEDVKKEDQRFEIDGITYIVEIKGATVNVRRDNVAQLENHVQTYIDDHEINADHVKGLLIINPQRNKRLKEREKVHDDQIQLAIRNGSLIITTEILLKMFESKLAEAITREEIIELLSQTGLLELS